MCRPPHPCLPTPSLPGRPNTRLPYYSCGQTHHFEAVTPSPRSRSRSHLRAPPHLVPCTVYNITYSSVRLFVHGDAVTLSMDPFPLPVCVDTCCLFRFVLFMQLALHSPLLLRTHLFYVGFKGHAENMLVNKPSRSHRAIAAAAATAPARTGRGRGSSAIEVKQFVLMKSHVFLCPDLT